MIRAEVPSYPVSIFIAGERWKAEMMCLHYCDDVGLCVTVSEVEYCYTGGQESGVVIGLINYPRFPSAPGAIWQRAEELAARLCDGLSQQSYTIQAPDKTVWFSHRDDTRLTNGSEVSHG
ncbi:MAG: hypothetical protein EOP58_00770 [Sphingomonadales bacterium]|nr:MAG: hypothetical protein EOP58_00770 [Sphingomonadales bacterium]